MTTTTRLASPARSLFDVSVGDDNLFHAERYKWSLQLTAINIANNYALYNFLSTFSGTHYVTPRCSDGSARFPLLDGTVKNAAGDRSDPAAHQDTSAMRLALPALSDSG